MGTGAVFLVCVLATASAIGGQAQISAPARIGGASNPPTPLNAISREQARDNGSRQGLAKLPDAPSSQVRLTPRQKFDTFVKRTYSPYTFASAAFNATWAQTVGDWYGYGGGMQGWGKRFGASIANTETRMMFSSFLLPVVFQQDPRYHPSGKRGLLLRAWYAGTRVLVTRSDDGDRMFNYSEVLGVLFTSSVQNAYYPERDRGFGDTMQRFTGGLTSDATTNLLREFSPELKRAARKLIPKRARKLEQKLPDPLQDMGGYIIP